MRTIVGVGIILISALAQGKTICSSLCVYGLQNGTVSQVMATGDTPEEAFRKLRSKCNAHNWHLVDIFSLRVAKGAGGGPDHCLGTDGPCIKLDVRRNATIESACVDL